MKETITQILAENTIDIIIHSMAISDYFVSGVYGVDKITEESILLATENLKGASKVSSDMEIVALTLSKAPKIIGGLREGSSEDTVIVGFKLLDGVHKVVLHEAAQKQLELNKLDYVLANDLSDIRGGNHIGHLLNKEGVIHVYEGKEHIAESIVRLTIKRAETRRERRDG